MVLKDGGEGLIRLSLKPESLGNVKIRLELSENKIAGHIIVENSDALRAFERELPVLEAAFKDSGFSGASLELAQNSADEAGGQRNREGVPFYSERLAASGYEASSDYRTGNAEAFIRGNTRVNMLA
jgi:flagellar hook-length control protein FliK